MQDKNQHQEIIKINNARDMVDQLQEELKHLQNMIEVLEDGFNQITCLERTSEISSLMIINNYLKVIEHTKLAVLAEILDDVHNLQKNDH